MKKRYLILLLLIIPCIAGAANYKGHVTFEVAAIDYTPTTADITLTVRLIGEITDKCESKILMPVVETPLTTHSFPYILISGTNKRHMYNRWKSLTGKNNRGNYLDMHTEIISSENDDTVVTYNLSIPKNEWTNGARLILREESYGCANEIYSMDYLIQEHVLREEVQAIPEPLPLPESPQSTIRQQEKDIYYHVNRSEIDFNLRNNRNEAADIVNLINNTNIRITAINITGYASPEGPYDFNENLAMQRAISVKKYIHANTRIGQEIVHINWIAENWKGLLTLLQENDIPNKYGVMSIIQNNAIPYEQRNEYIKLIDNGQTYNLLLREYYPQLRKVECQIYYENQNNNTINRSTSSTLEMKEFLFY